MPFPVMLGLGLGALALLVASSKGKAATPPSGGGGGGGLAPVTPGGPQLPDAAAGMPPELQAQMAECLRGLNVDGAGVMHPPITEAAIQRCTATAGYLEAAGYPNAGQSLREYARQAAALLPPVPVVVTTPAIPEEIRQKLNVAIRFERDPKKLREWAALLRKLPRASEPEVQIQVQWLEATAQQIEAEQATAAALEAIQRELGGGYQPMPIPNAPSPNPPAPPAPPGVTSPGVVPPLPMQPLPVLPSEPALPRPKSKKEQAAEAVNLHLWNLQNKYQTPKAVKASGKLDLTLIRRFQGLMGFTQDGKPGPALYLGLVSQGQGNIPLVLYWPKGATRDTVVKYQNGLESLAGAAEDRGDARLALDIRASASREKGQGGVA